MNFLAEDDVEMLKVELLKKMSNYDIPKDEDEPQPKRGKSALDILLGPEEAHATVTINDELEIYMSDQILPRNKCPLTWWKSNAHRFPHLAPLACSLLSVPATSTPSERAFSTAGLTISSLRSCLKPKNVDALVFLNKNIKFL